MGQSVVQLQQQVRLVAELLVCNVTEMRANVCLFGADYLANNVDCY